MVHLLNHTGLTFNALKKDKRGRLHCPECGAIVGDFWETSQKQSFPNGSIAENPTRWHSWECHNCTSYNQHGHNCYDESSDGYKDTAKECYTKEAK